MNNAPTRIRTTVCVQLVEPLLAALAGRIEPRRLNTAFSPNMVRRVAIASRNAPVTEVRKVIVQALPGSLEVAVVADSDTRSYSVCFGIERQRGQMVVVGLQAPDLI